MVSNNKSCILGVAIDNLFKKEILRRVEGFLFEKKFHQIVTINPEFILEAQKDKQFRDILNQADLKIADGIGIRFAFILQGIWLKSRVTGADLTQEILAMAERDQLKVFLAINKDGLSAYKEVQNSIKKIFPNILLHGANLKKNGQKIPSDIFKSDIVLCNFGAPYQEKFATRLNNGRIRLCMGAGGSFDYITGKISRAPKVLRVIGLEWLWRLLMQPQRLKRIFRATIVFPIKVITYKLLKTSAKGGFASGEKN